MNAPVQRTRIPRALVASIAADLGEEPEHTSEVIASLHQEGVQGAIRRFPHLPPRDIVRTAEVLREREITVVKDLWTRQFQTSGMVWFLEPVTGFEHFNCIISTRDISRAHLRIDFRANDVANGAGEPPWTEDDLVRRIQKDPQLRLNVARHLQETASHYLANALQASAEIPTYLKRLAGELGDSILSLKRLYPVLHLLPRVIPHADGDRRILVAVDVTFTLVCEIGSPNTNGRAFSGVEVIDNGALFEIGASAVSAVEDAANVLYALGDEDARKFKRAAKAIRTAIAPMVKRKRERAVLDQGPPPAQKVELVQIGDPVEGDGLAVTVDTLFPPPPVLVSASLREEVSKAETFWRSHKGLIKPGISELAANAIQAFGGEADPTYVDMIVDLALPRLGEIAEKRLPQYQSEFGHDAAVAGLGKLLEAEIKRRLR